MEFAQELLRGELVRRYKRFLADVRLRNGRVVTCHCPNPGSMRGCLAEGAPVWLSRATHPRRKLRYTWELVEMGGVMICVNTIRANEVVAEAIGASRVARLTGYGEIRREVRYGEKSRVDLLLTGAAGSCYVEVKSVTLGVGGRTSAFPDSVTERGARHLRELTAMVRQGHRAVLLFCSARTDTARVRPADEIDPRYGRALRQAVSAGVEVMAHRCEVSPEGIRLAEEVPVVL